MTASREKIVAMLLDGGMRQVARAREGIRNGDGAAVGTAITKAFAIVSELKSALDPERGGEIARNLDRLYAFILQRLVSANAARQDQPLEEACNILIVLKEGWDGVLKAS
jgi:flagellar protein FliS